METLREKSGLVFERIYPCCCRAVGPDNWKKIFSKIPKSLEPESFVEEISKRRFSGLPDYFGDLARLEWTAYKTDREKIATATDQGQLAVNPSLQLLELGWRYGVLSQSCGHGSKASGLNAGGCIQFIP